MYFLVLYSMSLNTALYLCVFVCLGVQGGAPSGGFWPGRGPPAGAGARAAGGQTALLCWGVRLPSGKSFYLFIYPSLPPMKGFIFIVLYKKYVGYYRFFSGFIQFSTLLFWCVSLVTGQTSSFCSFHYPSSLCILSGFPGFVWPGWWLRWPGVKGHRDAARLL